MSEAKSLGNRLRGFGPAGIAAILLILAANLTIAPAGAILVLFWTRAARVPWSELGFGRPRSWPMTIVIGLIAGILLKLLVKAVVMPFLGAPPLNPAFQFLHANRPAMMEMIFTSILVGGIGEEIVYRVFLFERLGRLLGTSVAAKAAIVLVTTALFASIHIPGQGLWGSVQAAFTGLAFGTIYIMTRRLWLPMIMHATYDVLAVLLIYLGLEGPLAQSIFG